MSFCTPRVVELHDRTLEPTSLDTFRPTGHLPIDEEIVVAMPGPEPIEEDRSRRLL
jgi:hypothetical protein